MKKLLALIIGITTLGISTGVSAAEAWRDAFVSRIINAWSTDSSCADVVLTDIDNSGIPEAFLVKPGTAGEIVTGITMSNNTIIQIAVPHNISGDCLKDITVFDNGTRHVAVGREIARYTNVIAYFELSFDGHTLTAQRVQNTKYASMKPMSYRNVYSGDFFSDGYPNRSKLQSFIYAYHNLNQMTVSISNANVRVNGVDVTLPGYTVDNNNYYKIRDIAMILKNTSSKFDVKWDSAKNAVNILTGKAYTVVGGELSGAANIDNLDIVPNTNGVLKNGQSVNITAYNINGNNFFKIRDIADIVGFEVGWDNETSTITIKG